MEQLFSSNYVKTSGSEVSLRELKKVIGYRKHDIVEYLTQNIDANATVVTRGNDKFLQGYSFVGQSVASGAPKPVTKKPSPARDKSPDRRSKSDKAKRREEDFILEQAIEILRARRKAEE